MEDSLPRLMEGTLEQTGHALEVTAGSGDSLAVLFRTALEEQHAALSGLIPLLEKTETPLSDVKTRLSIVYHDHEIAHAEIRAWVRSLDWMKDARAATARKALSISEEIKSRLQKAAALLEERYGIEEIKFVVPAFYYPQLR